MPKRSLTPVFSTGYIHQLNFKHNSAFKHKLNITPAIKNPKSCTPAPLTGIAAVHRVVKRSILCVYWSSIIRSRFTLEANNHSGYRKGGGGCSHVLSPMLRVAHLCFHFCPLVHGNAGKVAFTHPHTLGAHALLNVNTQRLITFHPIVVIQRDHYASGVLQNSKISVLSTISALLLWLDDTDEGDVASG